MCQVYWKTVNSGDTTISIALQCPCSGWVALGFSATGAMDGSDGIIGFIDPVKGTPNISAYTLRYSPGPEFLASIQLTGISGMGFSTSGSPLERYSLLLLLISFSFSFSFSF